MADMIRRSPAFAIGKKISKIYLDPQYVEGVRMTDPTIVLEDGTELRFVVQEAPDGSDYGITLLVVRKRRRLPPPPRQKPDDG